MNIELSEDQRALVQAIEAVCQQFDDEYWLARDQDGVYPHDFHQALADGGWLGIAMPEQYGGAGLGMMEAALMMHTISRTGAGFSGASAVHMNIFGLNPVVVFGNDEQRARFLPPLIQGKDKACFGVTEPNSGLDTSKLETRAVLQGDHYQVHGRKIWISTAQVANKILLLARTTPLSEVNKPT
ncbi:MAG: acyl-CoA dehydrogenase family protein, partial [Alcaligenes sp.]